MRRALVALSTLALVACQVDLEGARCDAPGTAEQCPDGQACGTAGTCSKRAASCSPCVQGTIACRDGDRMRCDGSDPDCGRWVVEQDCGLLVCNDQGQPAACECPAAGTDIYVDASQGGTVSAPPKGALSPPGCRFPAIPEALAVANAGTTVHVVGPAAAYPGLPIRVRTGVSLVADDVPPSPASRVLVNDVAGEPGVVLEDGARLEGFTVRAAPGDATLLGIRVDCVGTEKVTIFGVHVDADLGATLGAGIELDGACDVELRDVQVKGTTGVGLSVALASSTSIARMIGGRLEECQTGVALLRGDLRLEGTTVANNRGTGVQAGDGEWDTRFTANNAVLTGNADTALIAYANGRLDLQNNRICLNGAQSGRGSSGRKVGGICITGAPPPATDLVFSGNEVHRNAAVQVFVTDTSNRWTLDGGTDTAACSSTRNLFLGYGDAPDGRGLVADAPVNARWNGWEGVTPTPYPFGQDYEKVGLADVDVGTSGDAFCKPVPPVRPCP